MPTQRELDNLKRAYEKNEKGKPVSPAEASAIQNAHRLRILAIPLIGRMMRGKKLSAKERQLVEEEQAVEIAVPPVVDNRPSRSNPSGKPYPRGGLDDALEGSKIRIH